MCVHRETHREMNLFSPLLKLQHCPQIILTQRQCGSLHQTAHFALSKDTFPCMEWSPTVSHKSTGLDGEMESKDFQRNSPLETTEINVCGWAALIGARYNVWNWPTSSFLHCSHDLEHPMVDWAQCSSWHHGVSRRTRSMALYLNTHLWVVWHGSGQIWEQWVLLQGKSRRWNPSCLVNGGWRGRD